MSKTGSLIQVHSHDNLEILDKLSDTNGILYYQGSPIFPSVSKKQHNGLVIEPDGLYVDHSTVLSAEQYKLVTGFTQVNGELFFNGSPVTPMVTDQEIQKAIIDTLAILNGAIN